IFALVEGTQPLGEVSPLGVPYIPSTGECPDYDYAGFIHISVPLLEEKDTADLDLVLDVNFLPLPGQPLDDDAQHVADTLVNHGLDWEQKTARRSLQASSLHADGTPADAAPFCAAYRAAGFNIKHAERQVKVHVPEYPATVLTPAGFSAHAWLDYDIPEDFLDDV